MRGEYYTFAARRVFTGKNPPGGHFLHAKSLPHGVFLPVNSLRGRLFRGAISYRDTGTGSGSAVNFPVGSLLILVHFEPCCDASPDAGASCLNSEKIFCPLCGRGPISGMGLMLQHQ